MYCLVALAPVWARAQHAAPTPPAEAPAHAAKGTPAHGDSEEAEKPALLQYDPGAAVWSILVFVLLLLVLRGAAWKPILRVLKEREEFIRKSIADAKHEREQAEQLLAQHRAQLDKAREQAGGIVEEGRRDADVVRQRILAEARQETAEMTARARRDIQLARDAAIKDLFDRTAELSIDVAARVLRKELTPADHDRLIRESLTEIRTTGKAKLN